MAYRHKRTGRWVAQVYEPTLGKNVQLGTYETKREAVAVERAARHARPSSRMTVADWWNVWLARDDWRESTRTHNRERTKRFVDEHGTRRLQKIDRTIARRWIEDRPSDLQALRAMFGAAQYEDDENGNPLIQTNPFSKLVRRRVPRRNLQADWLTDADIAALERCAVEVHGEVYGPTIAGMIRFSAETGVRPGELFALTDDDVHGDVVLIRRAADSKTRTIGPPKNGRDREAALSIRAQQAITSAYRVEGQTLLFATPSGKQFWRSTFHYYWHPVRCRFGRPDLAYYEARHFAATRLVEAGLSDYDASIALGHTDGGELVRRVYGHRSERRALERVRDELNRRFA